MSQVRFIGFVVALAGCSHGNGLKKAFARTHQCNAREVSMAAAFGRFASPPGARAGPTPKA